MTTTELELIDETQDVMFAYKQATYTITALGQQIQETVEAHATKEASKEFLMVTLLRYHGLLEGQE